MEAASFSPNSALLRNLFLCNSTDKIVPPNKAMITSQMPPRMPTSSAFVSLQYAIDASRINRISIQKIVSECLPTRAKSCPTQVRSILFELHNTQMHPKTAIIK